MATKSKSISKMSKKELIKYIRGEIGKTPAVPGDFMPGGRYAKKNPIIADTAKYKRMLARKSNSFLKILIKDLTGIAAIDKNKGYTTEVDIERNAKIRAAKIILAERTKRSRKKKTTRVKRNPTYKYANVSCSQCGRDFGPGNHGFSHCSNHRKMFGTSIRKRKFTSKAAEGYYRTARKIRQTTARKNPVPAFIIRVKLKTREHPFYYDGYRLDANRNHAQKYASLQHAKSIGQKVWGRFPSIATVGIHKVKA